MPWNFLQVVDVGATSDDLYPVPTGQGIGFEVGALDINAVKVDIIGIKVSRQTGDGPWVPSLNVLRTDGSLLITDRRLAVTFGKFVPKDLSSFDPIRAIDPSGPNSGRAKRPKQMVVGQVLMTQIRQIGVRARLIQAGKRKPGDEGVGRLFVSTFDDTGRATRPGVSDEPGTGDHVAIELILAADVDPIAAGNEVLARSAAAKLTSPQLSIDQRVRDDWAEAIRRGFTPAPGELQHHQLTPHEVVRSIRSSHVPSSLIPPTDTSPVPTMQPTPARPMPALAPPQPQPQPQPQPHTQPLSQPNTQPLPQPQPEPQPLPEPRPSFDPPTAMIDAVAPVDTVAPVGPAAVEEPWAESTDGTDGTDAQDRADGVEPWADERPALPLPVVAPPPPPGSTAEWRPDPFSRFELRYWDGFGWTEHVHANGVQSTDPPR